MRDGVVGDFAVAENLLLIDHATRRSHGGASCAPAIRRHCEELVAEFDVKTPGLDTPARNLSGGNIQKLILARELSARPRVLLAAQPTRGVDIGAAEYIHARLMRAAGRGDARSSSSRRTSTRCCRSPTASLVMYEGEIVAEARPRDEHARGARPDDGRLARRRLGTVEGPAANAHHSLPRARAHARTRGVVSHLMHVRSSLLRPTPQRRSVPLGRNP